MSGATRHRFHGHMPSISTSSEKLNTSRVSTTVPSTATLSTDWSTTIVRMMSAMMNTSRPSRITRPRFLRTQVSVGVLTAPKGDLTREASEPAECSDDQDRRPDTLDDVDDMGEEFAVRDGATLVSPVPYPRLRLAESMSAQERHVPAARNDDHVTEGLSNQAERDDGQEPDVRFERRPAARRGEPSRLVGLVTSACSHCIRLLEAT